MLEQRIYVILVRRKSMYKASVLYAINGLKPADIFV